MIISRLLERLKFPKERCYPIAFTTFLMYIAWHPLGDFIESLIIGWNIVPSQLFTFDFWVWWVPFAQEFQHSYTFAFFGYFIPLTVIFFIWFFLSQKLKINKNIVVIIIIISALFLIIPNFIPSKSIAYQNDISGFRGHGMKPLELWMCFHMFFWFVWMIFPHLLGLFTREKTMLKIAGIVWIVFLAVWISSFLLGKFIYIPI